MIEQMGENSVTRVRISLASMTWDAVEPIQKSIINERGATETLLSTGKPLDGAESDDHALK